MNKKHFFLILFTTTILATSLNEPTNIKTLPAILPEYETFTTTRTYITPTCDCIISTSPLGPQGHWESYCRNNTLKLKITFED